jgi:NADH-quinone oxidoreductase subunit J
MDLLLLFFGLSSVFASILVILSSNPVHSVLSLILVFCLTSASLIIITADFLGILLIVVYVGAIAVLFLFVIMMLNIKLVQLTESVVRWLPLVLLVFAALIMEILYSLTAVITPYSAYFLLSPVGDTLAGGEGLVFLGEVLYTYTFYSIILAGGVLLTALLGAITLTVGVQRTSRRQFIYKQVGRSAFSSLTFFK